MGMTTEPDQGQATGRGSIPVDSFANRLMLARAHAGHISIRDAADLCDLGRGAWTNWEKGARPADIIDVAAVVADKLGVDRDWLLFGGHLADAEPRSLRRIRTMRQGPGTMASYPMPSSRMTQPASRPRDNRPNGHPSATVGASPGRTTYLSRGTRRNRD
jgi:hypothetical protein